MMPYEEDINRGTEDFKSLVEILDKLELNNHYAPHVIVCFLRYARV